MNLFFSLPGLSPVASRELGDIFPINKFPSFGGTISDPWTSPHSLWSLLRVSCSSLEIASDFSFIPSSASSGLSHIPSYTISSTFHWPKDFFPNSSHLGKEWKVLLLSRVFYPTLSFPEIPPSGIFFPAPQILMRLVQPSQPWNCNFCHWISRVSSESSGFWEL